MDENVIADELLASLKKPDVVEYITREEFEYRTREIIKCKRDILYFANNFFKIINLTEGLQQIVLYDKQEDLLNYFLDNNRCIVLSPRQSSKTTTYTIFALWYICFHAEKKIMIAANKKETSIEILSRIQLAYEYLPEWLKPGVVTWNKSEMTFSNKSAIKGVATGSSAARGFSANILIIDEFAFVPPNICEKFFTSVYPIISSSKNSKIIIVSTPNGVGNMYHRLWGEALENAKAGITNGWMPFRLDWWDIPGRDEEWKRLQIATSGLEAFRQEYGNEFISSSFKKLIPDEVIEKFRMNLSAYDAKKLPMETIEIKSNSNLYSFKMWHDFSPSKTYIAACDVADGSGGDNSVIYILDITDISDMKICAKFSNNNVTVIEFAYIASKICSRYCNPYIAVESNSIGRGFIDQLKVTYAYEHFICLNKHNTEGIMSHVQIKSKACLWFKELLTTPEVNIELYDKELIDEMDNFVRKDTKNHLVYNALGKNMHDDCIMTMIWGLYVLNKEIIENYFNVIDFLKTKLDKIFPKHISSTLDYDLNKQDMELEPKTLVEQWDRFKNDVKAKVAEVNEKARPKILETANYYIGRDTANFPFIEDFGASEPSWN